ncbi:MAG: phage minor capsid protein [Bacillota bacterium]
MDKNEKLIQMYQEANFYLLGLIRSLEEGPTKRRKEQLLRQIREIIANLSENAAETAREIIEESYKAGSTEAIRQLLAQGIAEEAIEPTLKTVIHVRAVQAIVDETFYRILEANDNMTADVKERIEEVVFRANRRSLIEGVSRRQATKDAIAEMTARGITGITAKNGAQIPVDKYMANVIQYHQRQAHVEGNLNRLAETGQDLVYVNSVGITCDICAKYQGRVYSISGNDDRFPKLTVKPPYHGHCVHSTSAWVEEYQDELDVKKALKDSNKPFIDSRTEANIRKYEKMQREKSKKNEARKQWIRYKARMPDLPDLKTFASQKSRNTKLYQEWMEDYRKIGGKIKKRGEISE